MKSITTFSVILSGIIVCCGGRSLAASSNSGNARYMPAFNEAGNNLDAIEPRNVPDFPSDSVSHESALPNSSSARLTGSGTALRADVSSTTIPQETRLRLVLETPVDAKVSQPGDIFEAHTKDDLFLGSALLLAKGSLIRGRVCDVTKPRLLSRAAKIGLKLEQINTPVGEVIPLDAALEFKKGVTNVKGQLDPGTSLGSRVHKDVQAVTGMTSQGTARGVLVAANVATLGAPAVATAIGSSAVAIFREGDNVSFKPGQELEVLLTNDLGLELN